jgi:hypothetical protein
LTTERYGNNPLVSPIKIENILYSPDNNEKKKFIFQSVPKTQLNSAQGENCESPNITYSPEI